ncbi:MAG: dihydroorotate dehydrogenase-like protein [Chloroflexota bacterium]
MTDLSTIYLGMTLRSPLVPSASPLSEDLGKIKRMEDAGAAAIVLYSLFEEQLTHIRRERRPREGDEGGRQTAPRIEDAFPVQTQYPLTPHDYLEHIRKAKEAVGIPIIASLNCTSLGGWAEYAKQMQQAGADALELNIYHVPTDLYETGTQIERACIQIVEDVRSQVRIPLAVKIGPYYSNVANMAERLEKVGADALVLFNRFYQPDINLNSMKVTPRILLSTPQAMRLPLRWIAILYGRVHTDFAATSGIHEAYDVAKMLLAGADVTMLCSALLRRGIGYMELLERDLVRWMEEHNFESVEQMRGKMSQQNCPDPEAFERAHYIRTLQSYVQAKPGREA